MNEKEREKGGREKEEYKNKEGIKNDNPKT
jgi:hypothetical protein